MMTWVYISIVAILLTSTSGYRQIHRNYFERQGSREHRSSDHEYRDRTDRWQNERSIPFSSNYQIVDPDSIRLPSDESQSRNGNTSHRLSPFSKTSSISSRGGAIIDSDSVVFPGPTSRRHLFVPDIPEHCQGMGICESVPNYPHDYVNSLLSKIKDSKYRFHLDEETPEIAQRAGPEEENIELCQHNETIIYPSAAKNIQGEWVLVVNRANVPVQGFKAEICKTPFHSCSDIAYFNDEKYNATCHQKTGNRMMWSLNRNGEMVLETVPMPTCCTCLVRIIKT